MIFVSVLIFLFSTTATFFTNSNNTIEAAETTGTLSKEDIDAVTPYVTMIHSDKPYVEAEEDGGSTYEEPFPDEGGTVTPPGKKKPGDDPFTFSASSIDEPIQTSSTSTETTSTSSPVYYQYQISDTDMTTLESELGTEKANLVKTNLDNTNKAMQEWDLQKATYDEASFSLRLVGNDIPNTEEGTGEAGDIINDYECPPKEPDCVHPTDVGGEPEINENGIDFYWWGFEFSLTDDALLAILAGDITAADATIGAIFGGPVAWGVALASALFAIYVAFNGNPLPSVVGEFSYLTGMVDIIEEDY